MLAGCRNILIYLPRIVINEFNRRFISVSSNRYAKFFIIGQKYVITSVDQYYS